MIYLSHILPGQITCYCPANNTLHATNYAFITPQGLVTIFFYPSTALKKTQGRNLKCQIFIKHFFKIVLYWCLDLIRHNIVTHLKHNKYIFDISIPFCHHLYLSATLKQCFTEFAALGYVFHPVYVLHHVYMSVRGRISTCDLIGRLFLGSGLYIVGCPVLKKTLSYRVWVNGITHG